MTNYRLPLWIATILGCALILYVILLSLNQLSLTHGTPQFLSVVATGSTDAIQDTATVTLGVVAEGQTAQAVKDQSSNKMNQIIAFIKQSGIDDKDIKTSQFYLAPKYTYANNQQTLTGYQANQTITVKVKNIDKSTQQLEIIVDGAVTHGANQIQGINFSFADNEKLIETARKLAIDNAKASAQKIAADAGLKLGRIVNVLTSASNNPEPMFSSTFALAKSSAPQVELGSQEVFATVTVVFELR